MVQVKGVSSHLQTGTALQQCGVFPCRPGLSAFSCAAAVLCFHVQHSRSSQVISLRTTIFGVPGTLGLYSGSLAQSSVSGSLHSHPHLPCIRTNLISHSMNLR
jgi:hypothetical protein